MIRQLALVFLVVSCAGGCSASQKATESADLSALIDCSKAAVLPILGSVATIIMTGGVGWEAALEEIGSQAGELAEACAVKTVEAVLTAPTPTIKTALDPAAIRAMSTIANHGWKYRL